MRCPSRTANTGEQFDLLSGQNWPGDADAPVKFEGLGYIRALTSLSRDPKEWRTEPLSDAELALWREVEPYIDHGYFPPVYHDDGRLGARAAWLAGSQAGGQLQPRPDPIRAERREQNVFDWWRARNGIDGELSVKQQDDAWRKVEHYQRCHRIDLDKPIELQIPRWLLTAKPRPAPGLCWDFPEYHEEDRRPYFEDPYPNEPYGQSRPPPPEEWFDPENYEPGKQAKKARKKQASDQPGPQPAAPREARAPRVSDEEIEIVKEQLASGMKMTEVSDTLNQYLIEQGRKPISRPGLIGIINKVGNHNGQRRAGGG